MFKDILDKDLDGITTLRANLSATDFEGTLFAPHNDAIKTFLADLNVELSDLQAEYPSVLEAMVQYHVLPFSFSVAELTEKGNGIEKRGRRDIPGRGDKVCACVPSCAPQWRALRHYKFPFSMHITKVVCHQKHQGTVRPAMNNRSNKAATISLHLVQQEGATVR
eukprot:scaffold164630_cov17-Tisochrysis_lutea.AAC.1